MDVELKETSNSFSRGTRPTAAVALLCAGLLSGCGPLTDAPPDDDGADAVDAGNTDAGDTDAGTEKTVFSTTPIVFTAEVGNTPGVCFDFDANEKVDCDSDADKWDLFFTYAARSYGLWTNGGVHGAGEGGSIGPWTAAELDEMESSDDVPGMFPDFVGGVFAKWPWQEYDVHGTHDISANQRVYVVKNATGDYRVQILSYYGATGTSAMLQVRYALVGDDDVKEIEIDATAGGMGAASDNPANKFTYLDLDTGTVVDIDDATARASDKAWDLGFKRFDVIVNGGASGTGGVEAAIADKMSDLYNASGAPIRAKFKALSEDDALAAFSAVTSADDLDFIEDTARPFIINDGGANSWYTAGLVNGRPSINANPDVWWVVRSPDARSFAKLHVTEVDYLTNKITVELFVQPRR